MKNGKKQPNRKTKKAGPAKSKRDNAGKSKKEKTNTSIPKNVRGLEKPLKELTKKQIEEKGFNSFQAELIQEGFRVSKSGKVAVNDLKTGRLQWISTDEFKKHTDRFVEKQISKQEDKKKYYSDLFDIPLSRTSANVFDNVRSSEQLETLIENKMLRNKKGHFLSKKETDQIRDMVKQIEQGKAEFTLTEILEEGDLTGKAAEISGTPKDFFYWNLQNNVQDGDFGNPNIKIIDFDGNEVYNGKSSAIATSIMNKFSRKLDNLETVIDKIEHTRPYFTIPVKEKTVKGIHTHIEIDYSRVKSRLKDEIFKKYRTML